MLFLSVKYMDTQSPPQAEMDYGRTIIKVTGRGADGFPSAPLCCLLPLLAELSRRFSEIDIPGVYSL